MRLAEPVGLVDEANPDGSAAWVKTIGSFGRGWGCERPLCALQSTIMIPGRTNSVASVATDCSTGAIGIDRHVPVLDGSGSPSLDERGEIPTR